LISNLQNRICSSMMRYCNRCILPDSGPGITLDDSGLCTACRRHDDKDRRIEWDAHFAAYSVASLAFLCGKAGVRADRIERLREPSHKCTLAAF